MTTRDKIEQALDDHAASVASYERATVFQSPYRDMRRAEMDAARARLRSLLAPEPEPSEREVEAGARFIDGIQFSDQAWEAMPVGYKNTMRHRAKAVLLAAARAARQTGGANG